MINKLRRNYLFTNLWLISLVVLFILTAIYTVAYVRIEAENRAKLRALPLTRTHNVLPPKNDSLPIDPPIRHVPNYTLSFLVIMSSSGEIEKVESFIDMPDADYHSMAYQAWTERKNDSIIRNDGRIWQYSITKLDESRVHIIDGKLQEISVEPERYAISFLDVTDSKRSLNSLLMTLIVVFVLSLGLIYGISLFFANKAVKPISEAWEAQQRFIADASHDLKTPLAIISANADALQSDLGSNNRWLNNIKQELSRLARLTDSLLNLIKAEDMSVKLDMEMFNISCLVWNMSESLEPLVAEKGLKLIRDIDDGIIVKSNIEAVEKTISILLDNAVKYTQEGGEITVSLHKTKNTVNLEVSNTAVIPSNMLPHLFDRFYLADAARTGSGYGLGLAIAKALCTKIGAVLTAQSSDGITTFKLCL